MPKQDPALAQALGQTIPELDALSAADQKKLAADLNQAHKQHDAVLKKSMDDALSHIPFLLRGAVKKILGL